LEHGAEDYLIKRLFRPAAGQWLAADAKQIEYRLFAHYADSAKILGRYAENPETDFHAIVRELIGEARPSITRTEVKTFNFLKIYGGGVGAAARNLGVDEHTAGEISDAYDRQFPEARDLLGRAMRLAERRGWVKTMLGRRSRFPNGERAHKALNAVIQGTAADINKLVLVEAYKQRELLGLTLRLTVHDELDADLHDPSKLEAVRELLNTPVVDTRVPVLWDVGVGATWAGAK
jgi:DNA polymerase-1